MKKRFLAMLMITVLMVLTGINVCASELYAPDGRTLTVSPEDVKTWTNVGWYEYPVTKMYAPDGRSIVVAVSDVEAWVRVGWFEAKKMYNPKGEIKLTSPQNAQAYIDQGWYEKPVMYVYAPNGKKMVIYKNEFPEWYNVGWSIEPGRYLSQKTLFDMEPISLENLKISDRKYTLSSQKKFEACLVPVKGDPPYLFEGQNTSVAYFLNKKYIFVSGTLSPLYRLALQGSYFSQRLEELKVEFYLDGKKAAETDFVKINKFPTEDFFLDVRDCNFFEIRFIAKEMPSNHACTYFTEFGVGDMVFYKK